MRTDTFSYQFLQLIGRVLTVQEQVDGMAKEAKEEKKKIKSNKVRDYLIIIILGIIAIILLPQLPKYCSAIALGEMDAWKKTFCENLDKDIERMKTSFQRTQDNISELVNKIIEHWEVCIFIIIIIGAIYIYDVWKKRSPKAS